MSEVVEKIIDCFNHLYFDSEEPIVIDEKLELRFPYLLEKDLSAEERDELCDKMSFLTGFAVYWKIYEDETLTFSLKERRIEVLENLFLIYAKKQLYTLTREYSSSFSFPSIFFTVSYDNNNFEYIPRDRRIKILEDFLECKIAQIGNKYYLKNYVGFYVILHSLYHSGHALIKSMEMYVPTNMTIEKAEEIHKSITKMVYQPVNIKFCKMERSKLFNSLAE